MQLSPHLYNVSISKVGVYPLQSIIEQLKTIQEKVILVNGIKSNIKEMLFDSTGIHIIEKVISCFDEYIVLTIYDTIISNFLLIANNQNGYFCIKKMIHFIKENYNINRVMFEISNNFSALISNRFGNISIQTAIEVNI